MARQGNVSKHCFWKGVAACLASDAAFEQLSTNFFGFVLHQVYLCVDLNSTPSSTTMLPSSMDQQGPDMPRVYV